MFCAAMTPLSMRFCRWPTKGGFVSGHPLKVAVEISDTFIRSIAENMLSCNASGYVIAESKHDKSIQSILVSVNASDTTKDVKAKKI